MFRNISGPAGTGRPADSEALMITVKDIAKLSNVSQGTVSNVLNNRGNVSAEKIQRVMAAAKQLGYVANAQAKQLRKDAPLSSHVAVILPNITEDRYTSFFNGIKLLLEENRYTPLLFVTGDSPYREESIAKHVAEMRVSGIITVTSSISHLDIYSGACNSGAEVLYAFRETQHALDFIGFDFLAIGRQIGKRLLQQGYQDIAVISDPQYYPENRDLIQGLRETLQSENPLCRLQIRATDWLNISASPIKFLEEDQRAPDAIVLTDSSFLPKVQLAFSVASAAPCPPVITLSTDHIRIEQPGVTRYTLDHMYAGMQAARCLLTRFKDKNVQAIREPIHEILSASGFRPEPAHLLPAGGKTQLRVLLSKSRSSAALQRITPKFTRETGIEVQFLERMPNEVFPETLKCARTNSFDLVRNNMSCLPLFPPDIFYTFHREEFQEITQKMLPRIVQDFSYIHGQPQCIPFDIGTDMLIYRKDLFEDQLLQRMYYEQTGEPLSVPATFDQSDQIIRFFNRDYNAASPVQAGCGMNWDSPTELSSSFFLRYINYMKDRKLQRGKTQIDEEAVSKTLLNLYNCGRYALPVRNKEWVGATLEDFVNGQTALELVFLNYASNISHLQRNIYGGLIGYTCVPGGTAYITGGSLSIFADSPNIEASKMFVRWISSYEQAELITLYGGLAPYADVYHNSEILMQYPWYSNLLESLDAACGRELWEVFDVYQSTVPPMPLLQSVIQGQRLPEEVFPQMMELLRTALLPPIDNLEI